MRKGQKISEETRARMRKAAKKRCEDPKYKDDIGKRMKALHADPDSKFNNSEYRENHRNKINALHADPNSKYNSLETKEKRKKSLNTPECRSHNSKMKKEQWSDPNSGLNTSERRKKISEAVKKRYEDPEERKKVSEATKKRYEDPEERQKQSIVMKEVCKDPKIRKRLKKLAEDNWKDPGLRLIMNDDQKKRWKDPGYRNKVINSMKEWHEKNPGAWLGENCSAWKGGKSFEPYCENWNDPEFTSYIRERDGKKCLNPDCWGTCKEGKTLHRHHIDGNKKNCDRTNIICVCASCNRRAEQGDRKAQEIIYKQIMSERYGYEYDDLSLLEAVNQ